MPKTDLASEWGSRIRRLRQDRELTIFQLSQLSGIEQGNLSRIERGRQVPGDDVRIAIASALGVEVTTIFTYPPVTEAS